MAACWCRAGLDIVQSSSLFSTLAESNSHSSGLSSDPSGVRPAACIRLHLKARPHLQKRTEYISHIDRHFCSHTCDGDKLKMKKEDSWKCESQVWECIYQCLKMCARRGLIGWGLWVQFVKWVVCMRNTRWQVRSREVLKTRCVWTSQMGSWEKEDVEEKNEHESELDLYQPVH